MSSEKPWYRMWHGLAILVNLPPATDQEMRDLECDLGMALPPLAGEFLAIGNGGYLDYVLDNDRTGMTQLVGHLYSPTRMRLSNFTTKGPWSGRPLGGPFLPFAPLAWVMALVVMPDDSGPVVCLSDNDVDNANPSDYIQLAPTLRDFLARLRVDMNDQLDTYQECIASGNREGVESVREFLDLASPGWRVRIGLP